MYTNPGKSTVMYLFVGDINFDSFYDFDILLSNYFDSVVLFVFHFITDAFDTLQLTNGNPHR